MFKTLEEVLSYCKETGIEMVDFKTTDLEGRWHHITLPLSRLSESTMTYGIGFDGSNFGYAPVEKSDMVFIPDLSSATVDPFVQVPTLTMVGDVKVIDPTSNRPFDQYPRTVAKKAEEYMKGLGIADQLLMGPEFEFYVFDHASYEVSPYRMSSCIDTAQAWWNTGVEEEFNAGYQVKRQKGYHAALPQDITFDLRNRICLLLDEWGIAVKYHHHEVGGAGQVEVEVELGDLCEMADNTQVIKYVIKNAAVQDGRTATFLPKPIYKEAGSGMHVHMQLRKNGENLFYDETGYSNLSPMAHHFIGGLLKHAASLCAWTNPSTNSFKRLVPGYEAPVTIGYATANRSAVIRIPAYAKSPSDKRFELRNPDATCNPYYAFAAILMAGLDGIENKIDPAAHGWGPFDFNLFHLSDEEKKKIKGLPTRLEEALDALEEDHAYLTKGGVFPQRLIDLWIDLKRKEALEMSQIPNPAEFERYFDL